MSTIVLVGTWREPLRFVLRPAQLAGILYVETEELGGLHGKTSMADGQTDAEGTNASGDSLACQIVTQGNREILVFSFAERGVISGQDLGVIRTHLEGRTPPNCVLDLDQVAHIDGAFFGELLKLLKVIKSAGGALKLCGLMPPLRDVMRVTKMERVFEVIATREAALASFVPKG